MCVCVVVGGVWCHIGECSNHSFIASFSSWFRSLPATNNDRCFPQESVQNKIKARETEKKYWTSIHRVDTNMILNQNDDVALERFQHIVQTYQISVVFMLFPCWILVQKVGNVAFKSVIVCEKKHLDVTLMWII